MGTGRARAPGSGTEPATGGRDRDRGAATVLVVSAAGLLFFVGLALAGVAALVVVQRQAQAAADLAALAGAVASAEGGDACSAAAGNARANGATLVDCTDAEGDVRVRVEVPGPEIPGGAPLVGAEARAGPGDASDALVPRRRGSVVLASVALDPLELLVEPAQLLALAPVREATLGPPLEDRVAPQDGGTRGHADEEDRERAHVDAQQLAAALADEDRRDHGQ